jgi:hypothetical protein
MPTITASIKKRIACRTYADKPVDEKVLQEFTKLVDAEQIGPFGNKPQFQLINLDMTSPEKWKKLGTYGVIKNARYFLVGKIKSDKLAIVDYGYCKEKLILRATALGLGTCWLAGTFKTSNFAKAVDLKENEVLPTISHLWKKSFAGLPALIKENPVLISFSPGILKLLYHPRRRGNMPKCWKMSGWVPLLPTNNRGAFYRIWRIILFIFIWNGRLVINCAILPFRISTWVLP